MSQREYFQVDATPELVTVECYGCGASVSVDPETAQAARDGAIVRCVDCKQGHTL